MRPRRPDVLLALVLALWALLEALALEGAGGPAERVAWGLAFTLPLAWRREAPVGVAVGLAALVAARVLVAQSGAAAEEGAMPFPALLVATFTAAAHARRTASAVAAGLAVYAALLTAVVSDYYTGEADPPDTAILSFFAAAAWTAGYVVRRRGAGAVEQARDAVADERARISRELHDIIGHGVTVVALQAGAAEQLLRRDPDAAAEHLRAVQRTARETMAEMRRLMGVLREDDASYAPQPGLGAVGGLVEQARADGLRVELLQEGRRPELAPGVDLAAYRIVQEALTNARKHAGAVRAQVVVRYAADGVEVEVRNEAGPGGEADDGGHGLVGMAERARLFGGTLETASDPGGGFRVRARLPAGAPS